MTMTVYEAHSGQLITVGRHVCTNANGVDVLMHGEIVKGTITHVLADKFFILLDSDSRYPGTSWSVHRGNTGAIIEFLDETTSMSVREFYNNMKATPEEKLLKKYGIENPIGTPTAEGLELAALLNYNSQRAEIVKIVTAKEDEENTAKK